MSTVYALLVVLMLNAREAQSAPTLAPVVFNESSSDGNSTDLPPFLQSSNESQSTSPPSFEQTSTRSDPKLQPNEINNLPTSENTTLISSPMPPSTTEEPCIRREPDFSGGYENALIRSVSCSRVARLSMEKTYPWTRASRSCPAASRLELKAESFDTIPCVSIRWTPKGGMDAAAITGYHIQARVKGVYNVCAFTKKNVNQLILAPNLGRCPYLQPALRADIWHVDAIQNDIKQDLSVLVTALPTPIGKLRNRVENTIKLPTCRELHCPTGDPQTICQCTPLPPDQIYPPVVLSTTSVFINWSQAEDSLVDVIGYEIQVYTFKPVKIRKYGYVTDKTNTSYIFTDLKPDTRFTVRVISLAEPSQYVIGKVPYDRSPYKVFRTPKVSTTKVVTTATTVNVPTNEKTAAETAAATLLPENGNSKFPSEIIIIVATVLIVIIAFITVLIFTLVHRRQVKPNGTQTQEIKTSLEINSKGKDPGDKPMYPTMESEHPDDKPMYPTMEGEHPAPLQVIEVDPPPIWPPIPPPYVYMSYCRYQPSVGETVARLVDKLKSAGITVCFDRDRANKIAMADNIPKWIDENIMPEDNERSYIIIVLSDNYPLVLDKVVRGDLLVNEDFQMVEQEITFYTGSSFRGKENFLVPVYIGTLPRPFKRPKWFEGKKIYDINPSFVGEGLQDLVERLNYIPNRLANTPPHRNPLLPTHQ